MTPTQPSQAVEAAVQKLMQMVDDHGSFRWNEGWDQRGDNDKTADEYANEAVTMRDTLEATLRAELARPQEAEPVGAIAPEAVVTGALYGFASWLTCQRETISVGAREVAYPIIDALKAFAEHHKLSLDSPDVKNWRLRASQRAPVALPAEPVRAGADDEVGARLSEQDASLLIQANELLLDYAEVLHKNGHDSGSAGAECSADAVLRLAGKAASRPTPSPKQGDAKDARPDSFHFGSGASGRVHAFTPDEILECIEVLSPDHDGSDFESECPACTAYRKLAAILNSKAGPAAGEGK